MHHISITASESKMMLESIGSESVVEPFEEISPNVRLKRPLDLPTAQSEMRVSARLSFLALFNPPAASLVSFAGAGCHDHYVPSVVDHQSMICELTGGPRPTLLRSR